ncbi:mechanosensitive ion channel family protein [Neorhizobium alkalisoli]|jgi:small conductance mechanosensitive channel|uniref:Small-conductance mechanosensitive channel n=1 Tax=Neorhizobium alkalisoli TaxID=528178 RepID=A0A561R2P8_9HYPH|nr:mechanosensitive ion channel domain-containing protein [Neorhizobium alkalisoli]TWF56890.1 small conductance mechanosensitive channel [Neorhizobium alkalisoli]
MEQASEFVVATRAALAQLSALAVQYSFSVVGALVLLVIGWLAAGVMSRWAHNGLSRIHGIDATLSQFFSNIIRYAILVLVVVMVLGQFGVQTASVLAALGAIGLAVGLALQGTLQNIAAGIMLLVLRPFRVGESIETGSVTGTVVDVGLFATELRTADGVYRLAPNSTLWNVPVTNYSRLKTRRHEISVSIPADANLAEAQTKLTAVATGDNRVQKDPAPSAYVADFDAGSTKMTLRYWTKSHDWWSASRDLTKAVKLAFDPKPEIPNHQGE